MHRADFSFIRCHSVSRRVTPPLSGSAKDERNETGTQSARPLKQHSWARSYVVVLRTLIVCVENIAQHSSRDLARVLVNLKHNPPPFRSSQECVEGGLRPRHN